MNKLSRVLAMIPRDAEARLQKYISTNVRRWFEFCEWLIVTGLFHFSYIKWQSKLMFVVTIISYVCVGAILSLAIRQILQVCGMKKFPRTISILTGALLTTVAAYYFGSVIGILAATNI